LRSRRIPHLIALLLLATVPLGVGCAGFGAVDNQFVFEFSQRKYTQMIRWARFDKAVDFVDPEVVASFQQQAAAFGDVRFTDYQVRGVDMNEDGRSAVVQVTYFAYLRTQPVAVAFDEQQEWTKDDDSRLWYVRSSFAQRPLQPGEGLF
jgi:hypothetical protein